VFTITRDFTFCYGHRLLNYNGKCAHPHGHNAKVRIVLQSPAVDTSGMIFDFRELKEVIGNWMDKHLDHQMILQESDPLVSVLRTMNEPMFLMPEKPTAENLAKLIFEKGKELGLPIVSVNFWETEKCSAEYSAES
jgi:6-pyruvoyltetrahydropterin/6-carboxytetrahydropterin synthase